MKMKGFVRGSLPDEDHALDILEAVGKATC